MHYALQYTISIYYYGAIKLWGMDGVGVKVDGETAVTVRVVVLLL